MIATALVVSGGATVPQLTHAADSTQTADTSALQEVIVTARRVEERLQDVPISITVFSQEQLTNRNIINAGDLATYTPSLSVNSQFGAENSSFAIRGFNQTLQTAPTVGVYFADVVAPRGGPTISTGDGAGPGSFFDLQNVQVLKGPQGTLFGRNTTGGAILLVPQKPTSELGGYAEASYGNYDMERLQAVANIPVNDKIRMRFGMDRQVRDGNLKNVGGVGPSAFNNINYLALRGSLVVDLTPDLENYTIASLSRSDTHGNQAQVFACNQAPSPGAALFALLSCNQLAAMQGHGPYAVDNNVPNPFTSVHQWQVINATTWTASDSLTVKNIVSYAQLKDVSRTNLFGDNWVLPAFLPLGGTPISFVGLDSPPGTALADEQTLTEELRFSGRAFGDQLTWQAGGYFESSRPHGPANPISTTLVSCSNLYAFQCTDPAARVFEALGGYPPGLLQVGSITNKPGYVGYRDIAGYAQATYALTHQLKLTGGIRYTSDRTDAGTGNTIYTFPLGGSPVAHCGSTGTQVAIGCWLNFVQDSHAPTWLIDLDFKPVENVLTYVKYARGYRQGDINPVAPVGFTTFGPEKLDSYEIGAKTSFSGPVPGSFDIAAFYNDFTNQQIAMGFLSTMVPAPPPNGSDVNAGKSRVWGIEVEATATPFKGLLLDVGYTYLDTKLETLSPVVFPPGSLYDIAQPSSLPGDPLPYSPKNKVNVSATYTLPLDPGIGRISIGADYSYTDKALTVAGTPYGITPSYGLVNMNLSWNSIAGKPIDVQAFATNLTNKFYWTQVTHLIDQAGFEPRTLGEPRMYGVRLRVHFGH